MQSQSHSFRGHGQFETYESALAAKALHTHLMHTKYKGKLFEDHMAHPAITGCTSAGVAYPTVTKSEDIIMLHNFVMADFEQHIKGVPLQVPIDNDA
jgi:hypothetical protein